MGLAGLGLSARAAATVFPGVLRAPAYFTELWVVLGLAAFILLLAAYLGKLARYPSAVHDEASRFFFGVSASIAPLLTALLLYRAMVAAPLPEALRPSWFILLVPPSLIYANGVALFSLEFLEILYFSGLVFALALLVYARNFLRWPFAPSWWAFTFPLDALAYAAARYAQSHPSLPWRLAAAAALAVATLFVVVALWKTARSAASRAA